MPRQNVPDSGQMPPTMALAQLIVLCSGQQAEMRPSGQPENQEAHAVGFVLGYRRLGRVGSPQLAIERLYPCKWKATGTW